MKLFRERSAFPILDKVCYYLEILGTTTLYSLAKVEGKRSAVVRRYLPVYVMIANLHPFQRCNCIQRRQRRTVKSCTWA